MFNSNFVTIRELQRNYKKIGQEVNKTNKPAVVMSKNKPQFVIVSLKTLEKIVSEEKNSAKNLLELAQWSEKKKITGPSDLSKKHNEYTWEVNDK